MTRILVVDDQRDVAELVQAILQDAGYAVEAVYGGQAALTTAAVALAKPLGIDELLECVGRVLKAG
jgi:DNA-binding NtrC family response regulator